MYIEADKDGDMEGKLQDFFNENANTNAPAPTGLKNEMANASSAISNLLIESRTKQLYIEENEINEYLRI